MPSAVRKRSFGSVTLFWVDLEEVWGALRDLVNSLSGREEVVAAVLFGSLAEGRFRVGSDVDLLLLLTESPLPFRERPALYLPSSFPVDLDLFPYTLEEVRRGHRLAQGALRRGRALWAREGFDPKGLLEEGTRTRDRRLR